MRGCCVVCAWRVDAVLRPAGVGLWSGHWPSYLSREQCLRIAGAYQLGTDALERELRLGARHDTEATLMLLASVASRRVTMGNAGKEKALQQLTRMGGAIGRGERCEIRGTHQFRAWLVATATRLPLRRRSRALA